MSAEPVIDRVARALAQREASVAERDPPFREAAVALILVPRAGDADLLMLRRAVHATDPWSGQIGLPGGRAEPGDTSLLATAMRETREETALDLSAARVLGVLDELRPRTPALPPIIVRPFVVSLTAPPALTPSDEVAELFWAPLGALFDPRNARREAVMVRGVPQTVDIIDFGGRVIWGMTERIIRGLRGVL